jgi:hypothetical protein
MGRHLDWWEDHLGYPLYLAGVLECRRGPVRPQGRGWAGQLPHGGAYGEDGEVGALALCPWRGKRASK